MATSLTHPAETTAETSDILLSGKVTPQDLAYYREKGAVCIRGVLSQVNVEQAREAAAHALEAHLQARENAGQPRADTPQFHHLLRVYKSEPVFREIVMRSAVAQVARDLVQARKLIVFGDSLLIKEAGTTGLSPWHHDMPYWPVRGDKVCSVWVALDPANLENGGMEYIAGSHLWNRWFTPELFENGQRLAHKDFEPTPDFEAMRDQYEILQWDLEPGDVLIHHGMTLHYAGQNRRLDQPRRAYTPRYASEASWWEPDFHSVRGDPAAAVLQRGERLDRDGIHPVAIDLDQS